MDSYLASMYDTGNTLEKIAQQTAQQSLIYKLAQTLPAEIGNQVNSLTPEQLEEIAQEQLDLATNEQTEEGTGAANYDAQSVKEAQDQFAIADYMGRIMAHSLFNEIGAIKEAGAMDAIKGVGHNLNSLAHSGATLAKHHVGNAAKAVGGAVSSGAGRYKELMQGGKQIGTSEGVRRAGNTSAGFINKGPRGEALKSLGARAGTGLAVAGAGAGAHHMATKEASAFDAYTQQYAMNLIQEAGLDPSQFIEHVNATEAQQGQYDQQMGQQNQMNPMMQQQQQMNQRIPQQGMNQRAQSQGNRAMAQNQATQPQMNPMQEFDAPVDNSVKMANDIQMQFQQEVHNRALAMLSEAGYPVAEDDSMGANQDMSGMAQGAPAVQ